MYWYLSCLEVCCLKIDLNFLGCEQLRAAYNFFHVLLSKFGWQHSCCWLKALIQNSAFTADHAYNFCQFYHEIRVAFQYCFFFWIYELYCAGSDLNRNEKGDEKKESEVAISKSAIFGAIFWAMFWAIYFKITNLIAPVAILIGTNRWRGGAKWSRNFKILVNNFARFPTSFD